MLNQDKNRPCHSLKVQVSYLDKFILYKFQTQGASYRSIIGKATNVLRIINSKLFESNQVEIVESASDGNFRTALIFNNCIHTNLRHAHSKILGCRFIDDSWLVGWPLGDSIFLKYANNRYLEDNKTLYYKYQCTTEGIIKGTTGLSAGLRILYELYMGATKESIFTINNTPLLKLLNLVDDKYK